MLGHLHSLRPSIRAGRERLGIAPLCVLLGVLRHADHLWDGHSVEVTECLSEESAAVLQVVAQYSKDGFSREQSSPAKPGSPM